MKETELFVTKLEPFKGALESMLNGFFFIQSQNHSTVWLRYRP